MITFCYMKALIVEEDEIISLSNPDYFLFQYFFKKINQYGLNVSKLNYIESKKDQRDPKRPKGCHDWLKVG